MKIKVVATAFACAAALLASSSLAAASPSPERVGPAAATRAVDAATLRGGATEDKARSKPRITLAVLKKAVGTSKIINGDKIVASGTASKSLVGKTVTLQRHSRSGNKWVSTGASVKVAKNATFKITTKSAGSGSVPYRVVSAKTSKLNAGVSNARKITVWYWYNLADFRAVDWVGTVDYYDTVASIAGRYYPRSRVGNAGWSRQWTDFNLGYKCSNFVTTIGLSDDSASESKSLISTSVGGVVKQQDVLAVGQSKAINVNVTQGYRIRLEANRLPGVTRGKAAWGTPRLLCTAPPGQLR